MIPFPTLSRPAPAKIDWSLKSNTITFSSPLTGSVQSVEFPGARWSVSFSIENLTDDDAALLQAFLMKLRGQAGRFTLHNFARSRPRGAATGTPLVMGAAQTGTTLNTDGWTPSTTVLKAGDYFGVNGELKMAVADAVSDGSGASAIVFEPPLRASPADNASLTINKPTATFMLTEDTVRWMTEAPALSTITIQAIEAW
jgi:hypothetical protein